MQGGHAVIFSSYRFLFLYLPVTLLGFHLLRRTGRAVWVKLWLTAASLVFYGIGQPDFFFGFILLVVSNYYLGEGIARSKRKWVRVLLLSLTIVWDLGLLFWFKYLNFFLECLNLLLHTSFSLYTLLLPLGISFFTFQMLAYVIDVYKDGKPAATLLDYAIFVTFFPQLIVGPVVKREELLPQTEGEGLLRFETENIYRGILLFSVGCAKKILLADPLIAFASGFYGGDVGQASLAAAWAGVLAYAFAYYFDFSGYIDMARGIGFLFGVELPVNFNSPYKARNFADFWRRWNMTISRFFSESIFGSIFHFGDGILKLIFATLATFLVSGLWHGADWHYLVWGAVNGLLVCCANIMTLYRKSLPKPLAVSLTFFFSVLVRVLFDCNGMTQAVQVYRRLFTPEPWNVFLSGLGTLITADWYVLILLAAGAAICFCCKNSNEIAKRTSFGRRDAILAAVLLMVSVFNMSQVSGFLYFNF